MIWSPHMMHSFLGLSHPHVRAMFDISCRIITGCEVNEVSWLHLASYVKGSGDVENVTTIGGDGIQKWYISVQREVAYSSCDVGVL